jgi:hypothetical protein
MRQFHGSLEISVVDTQVWIPPRKEQRAGIEESGPLSREFLENQLHYSRIFGKRCYKLGNALFFNKLGFS